MSSGGAFGFGILSNWSAGTPKCFSASRACLVAARAISFGSSIFQPLFCQWPRISGSMPACHAAGGGVGVGAGVGVRVGTGSAIAYRSFCGLGGDVVHQDQFFGRAVEVV